MAVVDSSLAAIRKKVRKLTRSVSEQLLPTADIDSAINTFLLYDLPEHVHLFDLRKVFKFYTSPNVDTYSTNTQDPNNPMYDFKNMIPSSGDPAYVSGYRAYFSQSRDGFFATWPFIYQKMRIANGDGAATNFSGTVTNKPVLAHDLLFTSIDANGLGIGMTGVAVLDPVSGRQTQFCNLYPIQGPIPSTNPTVLDATNNINVVTGVYNVTFTAIPAANKPIHVQSVPYAASRPISMLFFDNTFTLRPVPDDVYEIKIESYTLPTEILNSNAHLDINAWWQYVAYGAAKKILEDRNDLETVQLQMAEFKEQEALVLRKTLVQQGDDRASTIYSQQSSLSGAPGWWWRNFY